jgi:fatty acyl-CoA reductase
MHILRTMYCCNPLPPFTSLLQLLASSLFNMLHDEAARGSRNAFHKVAAVEGDMNLPGLGLCADDAALLAEEVQLVIHCAASLELDAPIQKTLRWAVC